MGSKRFTSNIPRKELLESIVEILGCEFLSDLHRYPYNYLGKLILKTILMFNPKYYSENEISDAIDYLN